MDQDQGLDELVEQARRGDPLAFEALWRRFSPVVAGYLRSLGATEADDVTSDVFLAVFRRLPEFVGDGALFRTSLFTIAHHRAVDAVRGRVRRPPELPYDADLDHRAVASAEDAALEWIEAARFRQLLDMLSVDQREVLLLRLFADLSIKQVAEVTGRTAGAVQQLQRRALAQLSSKGFAKSAGRPYQHHDVPR